MDRQGLRRLVELAIAVALTTVLSQIRVYKLPQGGSITAGSMVPIFYVALRWGFRWGLLAGLLAGVVNYITEPFYVHPVQVLLDYPIAFGAIGLAGLFQRRPVAGVVVGGAGRFVALVNALLLAPAASFFELPSLTVFAASLLSAS